MTSSGTLAADAAVAAVLLTSCGVLWRASSVMTKVQMEVQFLRRDVDRMVSDKDKSHSEMSARIGRDEQRLLDHEQWHAGHGGGGRKHAR